VIGIFSPLVGQSLGGSPRKARENQQDPAVR
jgi:hypothetical protein